MPPKKKKSDNKASASSAEIETADQTEWKALKIDADRLHKQSKKEEHDFNEFQQQREKLNYFWIVEKKKLEDKRAELRNKEREFQDLEEKHQVEIKIYKQRLKHLLLEHQHEIANKKLEAELAVKMAQDDDREVEVDIKEDKRNINKSIKEVAFTHNEFIRSLRREQDQKVTELRHQFERRANEIIKTFESRTKETRERLDKSRKDEIKSIEEKKATLIDKLLSENQKAVVDIKNYYNDITHNNLDLIKSLKEEVKELEAEERKDQIRLNEKKAENRKLSAPLKRMQEELLRLRSEYEDYKHEKADMTKVKAALALIESEYSNLKWENETLIQRHAEIKKERDDLRANLQSSVFDVKQKTGFRSLLLEKKLGVVERVLQGQEAQLNEVLRRSNLDPTEYGQINMEVADSLNTKGDEARKLQLELSRLRALQESFNGSVVQKLKEYGLHVDELGFPLPAPIDPKSFVLASTAK
jgi:growth arrest-specific protein 8